MRNTILFLIVILIFNLSDSWILIPQVKAQSPIVINEFQVLGTGDQDIELYNPTSSPVILTDWIIKIDQSNNEYTFPDPTTIPANGYFVVDDTVAGWSLNGDGDLIQLFYSDGITIVDQVAYGHKGGAPDPGNGDTCARVPNGQDTDDDAADWTWDSTPTWGAVNDAPAPNLGGLAITINEVLPNPSGSESVNEFIELKTTGIVPIKISGWQISDGENTFSIPAFTIPSNGYYTVNRSVSGLTLSNSNDNVYLYDDSGVRFDQMGWSSDLGEDWSLARIPDGVGGVSNGYNQSTSEFIKVNPTPNSPNQSPPQLGIVINEFGISPTSNEDIELHNPTGSDIEINNWLLTDGETSYYFPVGVISAAGYVLVDNADHPLQLHNEGDEIELYSDSTLIDRVAYGTHGGAPDVDDGGTCVRAPNGQDTDDDAADWTWDSTPTWGAVNDAPAPNLGGSTIVINEVNSHPGVGGDECVELKNTGSISVDIGDWGLTDADSPDPNPFTFPLGTVIDPGEYISVNLPGSIGDGNEADNIYLYDAIGARVDQMGFSSGGPLGKSWNRIPDGLGGTHDGYDSGTSGFLLSDPSCGSENIDPRPPLSEPGHPVGGYLVSTNKFSILAPYITLIGLIGAISSIFAIRRWRKD